MKTLTKMALVVLITVGFASCVVYVPHPYHRHWHHHHYGYYGYYRR